MLLYFCKTTTCSIRIMRILKIKIKEWQKTSYKVIKKASKLAFGATFDSLYTRAVRKLFRQFLIFSYEKKIYPWKFTLKKTRIHLIKVQIFKSMTSLNHSKLTNLHLSNDLEQPQNNRNTILTRFVAPLLWTPLKKNGKYIQIFISHLEF